MTKKLKKKSSLAVRTTSAITSRPKDLFPRALLEDVRLLIEGGRHRVATAVNLEMVTLYWSIGGGFKETSSCQSGHPMASKLSTH